MYTVVFDIETYGSDKTLSYKDFKYLKERGKHEEDEHVIDSLSLNPFLSHIISVAYAKITNDGLHNIEVIFLADESIGNEYTDTITYMGEEYKLKFTPITFNEARHDTLLEGEKQIIGKFLNVLSDATLLVSFNGKKFDAYFLKIRSMVNDIPISEILYNDRNHLDIMEFLFPRGVWYYSFDFVITQFGLQTPKVKYDGKDVKNLFEQGRYKAIAEYNVYDVIALYKLYEKLKRYIVSHNTPKGEPSDKQIKYLCDLINKASSLIQEENINLSVLKSILDRSDISGAISTLIKIRDNAKLLKQGYTPQNWDDTSDEVPF